MVVRVSTRPQTGGDQWDTDRLSNRWISTRGSETPRQPRDGLQRRSDGCGRGQPDPANRVCWRWEGLKPGKSSDGHWDKTDRESYDSLRIGAVKLLFTAHQLFDTVLESPPPHCSRPIVRIKTLTVSGPSLALVDEPDIDQFVEMVVEIVGTLFRRRLLILASCRCGVEEDNDTASAVSDTNDSAGCV